MAAALGGWFVRCRACGASVPVPRADGTLPTRPVAPPPPATPLSPSSHTPAREDRKLPDEAFESPLTHTPNDEIWLSGGAVVGLGLIALALVWLVGGLALGVLYFGSIFMLFAGLATFVTGVLTNR